jgi:hypothetical protein
MPTVGKWRERFRVHLLEGLRDEPRPGAPRSTTDQQVERVVRATLETLPEQGAQGQGLAGPHPRFHLRFTPTGASWLNLVERLFRELTERCVRRDSYTTVRELEKALLSYLDWRNQHPKPFVWVADAELIVGKVARLCKRISNSGH